MKVYKITCQGCREIRDVSQQNYSNIINGKRSGYCNKCRDRSRPSKEYRVICPICNIERLVSCMVFHHVKSGRTKGLCEKCTIYYRSFGNGEEIVTLQSSINEVYLKKYKEQKAISDATYQSNHRDKFNEYNQKWRQNNLEYARFKGRIKELKRRAFSHISKNIIEQIIEEHTINGIIYCYICKTECSDNYHIDHVKPIVRGGRNNKDNLKLACSSCNLSKGSKDLEEFLERNPYLKNLKEA